MTTSAGTPAPNVYTRGTLTYRRTHVWTDDDGTVHGLIDFGAAELVFHGTPGNPSAQVHDLIAHLVLLAEEMNAHAAGDDDPEEEDADPPPCPECGTPQPFHAEACSWRLVSDTLNAARRAALSAMETACDLIEDAVGGAA